MRQNRPVLSNKAKDQADALLAKWVPLNNSILSATSPGKFYASLKAHIWKKKTKTVMINYMFAEAQNNLPSNYPLLAPVLAAESLCPTHFSPAELEHVVQRVKEKHSTPMSKVCNKKAYKDANSSLRTGDVFAKVYIPRLGDDWVRLIGEGIKWEPVLNKIGVGHYPYTQFPGEVGNFAVAAHRGGFGGSFKNIHRISLGDHVYVQTNAGWFDYEYRQTKIVLPEEVGVIKPIPEGLIGAVAGGKYMTLTSCEPIFVNTHRIIVWLELVGNSPAPNH